MTPKEIRGAVIEALAAIAPEGDYDRLRGDKPLRDQLDIDSFDFLNVVIQLHEKLGVEVPEADYPKLVTLDSAVAYLVSRKAGGRGEA
jgi:acyl carrier protein